MAADRRIGAYVVTARARETARFFRVLHRGLARLTFVPDAGSVTGPSISVFLVSFPEDVFVAPSPLSAIFRMHGQRRRSRLAAIRRQASPHAGARARTRLRAAQARSCYSGGALPGTVDTRSHGIPDYRVHPSRLSPAYV